MKMRLRLYIIIFIFVCLLGNNITAWGYTLPLPQNTIKQHKEEMRFNNIPYTLQVYQSQLYPDEIISFYKENLLSQGFILFIEDKVTNTLMFHRPQSNDNLAITIIKGGQGDLTSLSVSHWRGDLSKYRDSSSSSREITKDALGKDVPGIPRYPGSIRISSVKRGPMKNASYRIPDATKEEIVSFYEREMSSRGWQRFSGDVFAKQKASKLLPGDKRLAGSDFLLFEKKDSLCGIMVTPEIEGCGPEGCGPEGCGPEDNVVGILLLPRRKEWKR